MRSQGLGVAAISYDSIDVLKNFAARKQISIPLLSDPDSAVIRSFGILNESIPRKSPFFGVPRPTTYMVDADGRILSIFAEEDFRSRYTTGAMLSEAAADSSAVAVKNTQLQIETSASDTTVRGGERVRLFIKLKLHPGVHVYAPGVEGYIPVAWKLNTTSAAQPLQPLFPKARLLRLEAIDETVPAYEGDVTISQDIVIAQPKQIRDELDGTQRFRITGTFRYQACDSRKCYVPEEVPVQWSFRYEQHDSTRVPPELQRK